MKAAVYLTVFLIAWTAIVYPHSEYGDNWAILPAVAVLPSVVVAHIYAILNVQTKLVAVLCGVIYVLALFPIWVVCLMLISKDSL